MKKRRLKNWMKKSGVAEERQASIERLITQARGIVDSGLPDQEVLGRLKSHPQERAGKIVCWDHPDFTQPDATENKNRFNSMTDLVKAHQKVCGHSVFAAACSVSDFNQFVRFMPFLQGQLDRNGWRP